MFKVDALPPNKYKKKGIELCHVYFIIYVPSIQGQPADAIVQLFILKVKLDFKVSGVPVFTSVTVDSGF